MDKKISHLPYGELEMTQAVWDCEPPVSRGDVEEKLHSARPLASTTILTLLTRLKERGALKLEKQGRSNLYTPIFSRQEYLAAQSGRLIRKLCGGDLHLFASALCDSGLSREEVEELSRLLEEGEL